MIKLFALRPTSDRKLYRKYLKTTAPTIQHLFQHSLVYKGKFAKEIGENEMYNLCYHLGHVDENDNKIMLFQNCIGIDIDGIDKNFIPNYITAIEEVTQTDSTKSVVIASGNGLHYLILCQSFKGEDHFATRSAYTRMIASITDALIIHKLQFSKVDPMAHKYNATLRFPHTQNRKPMREPFAEDANVTECCILNWNLENQNFTLDKWKIAEDEQCNSNKQSRGKFNEKNEPHLPLGGEKDYSSFAPDVEYIFKACDFLGTQLRERGKNADEPQWQAALGVVVHFPDGESWAHMLSEGHHEYTRDETQWKLEAAVEVNPRTCGHIATLWDGCKKCPHYSATSSPIGLSKFKPAKREIQEVHESRQINLENTKTNFHVKSEDALINDVSTVFDVSSLPQKVRPELTFIAHDEKGSNASYITVKVPCWSKDTGIQFPFPEELASKDYPDYLTNGFTTYEYDKAGRPKKALRHEVELAYYMFNERPWLWVHSLKRVYFWESGVWSIGDDSWFEGVAQEKFAGKVKKSEISEFSSVVRRFLHADKEYFAPKEGFINFENGVLNMVTDELLPHSPSFNFQYKLPYAYDSDAKDCKVWDELMDNLMLGRKHLQQAIEEFIGYILYGGEYRYAKALILAGSGNNGKTTLIKIIQMLVGSKNCSAVGITSLHHPFDAVNLDGKLANVSEESPADCFKDTGMLKQITGDSSVYVARKFEQGYQMSNRAKIILSYNTIPYLSDTSEGMRRRLMIVPFELNLEREPTRKIKDLMYKLQKELPAIFNRCIAAFKIVQKNDSFTQYAEAGAKIAEMIRESSAEATWFHDFMEFTCNEGDFVATHEMFLSFQAEYPDRKIEIFGFSKRIKKIIESYGNEKVRSFDRQFRIDGKKKKISGFCGIRFNDSEEQVEGTVIKLQENTSEKLIKNNFDLL